MMIKYTPADIVNIYQLTEPINEERVNIAILAFGAGYLESDLQLAWEKYSITNPPNIEFSLIDGAVNDPYFDTEATSVLTRDIELAGAITPNSNITVYFGPLDESKYRYNVYRAAIYAVNKPKVIICSWFDYMEDLTDNQREELNQLLAQSTQMGITFCVPSNPLGMRIPSFPAISPWVLACGATDLIAPNGVYCDPETKETLSEITNHGFYEFYQTPQWQYCLNPNKYRSIPDVSAAGSLETTVKYYLFGEEVHTNRIIAGTIWGAYLARLDIGFANPKLYEYPDAFHRVTCDLSAGLGSIDGASLTRIFRNNNQQN